MVSAFYCVVAEESREGVPRAARHHISYCAEQNFNSSSPPQKKLLKSPFHASCFSHVVATTIFELCYC